MIASLLMAQQVVYVVPPYTGAVPPYEAECELLLGDQSEQVLALSAAGSAVDRKVELWIDGQPVEVWTHLDAAGTDEAGRDRVDERLIVTSGPEPRLMYAFRYSLPGPEPVVLVSALRLEGSHYENFGTGLCWTKVTEE